MNVEYGIFYTRDKFFRPQYDQPEAAIKIENNTLTMTAPQQYLNRWIPIFETSPSWKKSLTTSQPLLAFQQTMSIPPFQVYQGKEAIEYYNTAIMQLQDTSTTVTINVESLKKDT